MVDLLEVEVDLDVRLIVVDQIFYFEVLGYTSFIENTNI